MTAKSDTSGAIGSGTPKQMLVELLGIARGLLADRELSDEEIHFLRDWLDQRYPMISSFPGNVIHKRIEDVLEDGVVTEEERSYLVDTLNMLLEDRLDDLAEQVDLTELWFDEAGIINFRNTKFCLTGNFVYGPKEVCKTAIEQRGGIVSPTVNPESQYLVVGGLGVDEWRTGGLGEAIEKAMRFRAQGRPVKIIPEDSWATQLN
jgi:NAD-dependent DNA ligase